jgi:biopolymer transport protein ExbD
VIVMQLQTDAKPYDDINITPMLDLAYVLLIIFIVMTTATVQGMKVNLPKVFPKRPQRRSPYRTTGKYFSIRFP